jgi:hypothetical protein
VTPPDSRADLWVFAYRLKIFQCPLGNYFNGTNCFPCSNGSFLSPSLRSCSTCGSGFYSSTNATTTCFNCTFGFYSANPGSSSCKECLSGSFSSNLANSFCGICSSGSYALNRSSSCIFCEPGLFSSAGSSFCSQCKLGQFQSEQGGTSCLFCPQGQFANETGLSSCLKCPRSTTLATGSVSEGSCTICDEGFFGVPPGECFPCALSEAISCPVGSSIPIVAPGYFRIGPNGEEANTAIKCVPQEACLETGNLTQTLCSSGYTGYFCATCLDDYYRLNFACKSCPGIGIKIFTGFIIFAFLLFFGYRTLYAKGRNLSKIRLSINSIQMIALFPVMSTRWPPYWISIFSAFSFSVSFDLINSFLIFSTRL